MSQNAAVLYCKGITDSTPIWLGDTDYPRVPNFIDQVTGPICIILAVAPGYAAMTIDILNGTSGQPPTALAAHK